MHKDLSSLGQTIATIAYIDCTSYYCLVYPEYYLVGWLDEEAFSPVAVKAIVEESDAPLVPGAICHVRSRGKVYGAKVIASGNLAQPT